MMAKHWLPMQGFDEDLVDSGLGEVGRSKIGEIEKLPPAPNGGITATPQKRRAAAHNLSPRKKKNPVAAKGVVSSGELAIAKNKGEEGLTTSRPDPDVTTTATSYHQTKGHAPATTHESGMTIKEEEEEEEEEERTAATTKIIKPDPDQSSTATIPTTTTTITTNTTPKNKNKNKKKPKKANPKSSSSVLDDVSTEKNNGGSNNDNNNKKKTKVVSLPMPTSWAEAGVADRMLLSMRDSGEDWAKIRKEWKEVTGANTAASTLPTRYSRLKASMTVLEDGDVARLIHAKDQVELRLETEKYAMIADTLEQLGGKRYSNVFIRKEVKKLEKSISGGAVGATPTTPTSADPAASNASTAATE